MNLGEKKESSESSPLCNKELANVESVVHSVDIPKFETPQNDDNEITTTICEEQAKADIYLADITDDGSKKKYKCPACDQSCTKRSNVRRHIKRFHEGRSDLIKQVSAEYAVACLLCEQKFSHIVYLKPHLTKLHGMQFDEQEYFFATTDEFLEWKADLEKRTDSVYIKQTGEVKRKDGLSYSYFKCNRSGNYKPRLSANFRKRKLKPYGTVKMNSHCTSVMKLIHGMNGGINVTFCATHYGHDGFKECREAMLENTKYLTPDKRNKKIVKVEDSKMIGGFQSRAKNRVTDGDVILSPLSNESIVSIILEAGNCKTSFICDKEFATHSVQIEHSEMKPDFQNNETILVSQDVPSDHLYASPNSTDDAGENETCDLPLEDNEHTPKQKLVSNLRKLVNIIESCESDELLDIVATGVDELVSRFSPLIENQHTEESMKLLFDNS